MAIGRDRQELCTRFHRAVELIGARWTGAILQILMQGPVRYADLRAAVPDISDRMLCERLRDLEEAEIVLRSVSQEPPVRVEYQLSEKGEALEPSLRAIGEWAAVWIEPRGEGTKNEERRTKNRTKNKEQRTGNRTKNAEQRTRSSQKRVARRS